TSVRPPLVKRLHYEFDGWLGDDLLEAFPIFIITDRLKDRLQTLGATGYELDNVKVTKSEFYRAMEPDSPPLPGFHWLKVTGVAGADDFGIAKDRRLVVSERAMRVLRSLNVNHCASIEDFP